MRPSEVYDHLEQVFDELQRAKQFIDSVSLPHEFKRIDINDALQDVSEHLSEATSTMVLLGDALKERAGVELFREASVKCIQNQNGKKFSQSKNLTKEDKMNLSAQLKAVARQIKGSDKEALERHLEQNPIQGQEFADTVYVSRTEDLDDPIFVAFMWNGHGHQAVHVIGTSDRHPDEALQAADQSGEEEYWVEDIREAEAEWYKDKTGRDLEEDYKNDDVDEKYAQEANEVAHEMIDGVVYTMTKGEFGEVAKNNSDISMLYDEDIDD